MRRLANSLLLLKPVIGVILIPHTYTYALNVGVCQGKGDNMMPMWTTPQRTATMWVKSWGEHESLRRASSMMSENVNDHDAYDFYFKVYTILKEMVK